MAMLEVNDVHAYYGNIHALKGVSCSIPKGEIACLIGANGAGKSTTLMTIFGVQQASQGEIRFKGKPIHNLRPEKVATLGVSQSPEGRQIFPRMSTHENLEMGAFLRKDKAEVEQDLEWVFSLFPVLKDRMRQLGGTLSGGEQQMLAIGRALMSRPQLLLLDEPSSGMNMEEMEDLSFWITDIKEELGITVLLVEHNMRLVKEISDRVLALNFGVVIAEGGPAEVLNHPEVMKAYLGEEGVAT